MTSTQSCQGEKSPSSGLSRDQCLSGRMETDSCFKKRDTVCQLKNQISRGHSVNISRFHLYLFLFMFKCNCPGVSAHHVHRTWHNCHIVSENSFPISVTLAVDVLCVKDRGSEALRKKKMSQLSHLTIFRFCLKLLRKRNNRQLFSEGGGKTMET